MGVLFESGCNILRFYLLRERLGLGKGEPEALLEEMRALVVGEMENSEKMIRLCERDPRLGYHSEAEGFKFFPAKLENRVCQLKELLDTEFPQVEERIRGGKWPLGYYEAEGETVYPLRGTWEDAPWESVGEHRFRAAFDESKVYLDVECPKEAELLFRFEGQLFHPVSEIWVREGKLWIDPDNAMYRPLYGDLPQRELTHYALEEREKGFRITADRRHIRWTEDRRPFKLLLKVNGVSWVTEEEPVYVLGQTSTSANEFGWLKTM